jgi:molybdate transport system permease protein
MASRWQPWAMACVGAMLALLLLVPLVALVAMGSWREWQAGLGHPLVAPALRLSLGTSCASLLLLTLTGTPLAWVLARSPARTSRWLETALQLPVVMPPAVAGLALLLAFGRRGWLDTGLPFSTGAVVVAQVFVAAPLYVQAAVSAFRRLDPQLLAVAETWGASPWRLFAQVGLPLAWPGLAAGAALAWARALGEFGATLMFAGNLEGRTQTLPLAVYTALESDLRAARTLAVVLVAIALVVLLAVRALERRRDGGP